MASHEQKQEATCALTAPACEPLNKQQKEKGALGSNKVLGRVEFNKLKPIGDWKTACGGERGCGARTA